MKIQKPIAKLSDKEKYLGVEPKLKRKKSKKNGIPKKKIK